MPDPMPREVLDAFASADYHQWPVDASTACEDEDCPCREPVWVGNYATRFLTQEVHVEPTQHRPGVAASFVHLHPLGCACRREDDTQDDENDDDQDDDDEPVPPLDLVVVHGDEAHAVAAAMGERVGHPEAVPFPIVTVRALAVLVTAERGQYLEPQGFELSHHSAVPETLARELVRQASLAVAEESGVDAREDSGG